MIPFFNNLKRYVTYAGSNVVTYCCYVNVLIVSDVFASDAP